MIYKTIPFVLVTLLACAHVHATVEVLTGTATPDYCDEEGERCQGGQPANWVTVYTPAEVDGKVADILAKLSAAQAEIAFLNSQIKQREADIKFLAAKADGADRRIAQLDKSLNEMAEALNLIAAKARMEPLKPFFVKRRAK